MKIVARIDGVEAERLYEVQEVADLIGRSRTLVYEHIADGRLASERFGHARLVRGDAVVDYVMDRVRSAIPATPIEWRAEQEN